MSGRPNERPLNRRHIKLIAVRPNLELPRVLQVMIEQQFGYISALLQREVVDADVAPGAAACVAVRYAGDWVLRTGVAGNVAHTASPAITHETLFDLASVTKSVVAFACARAVDAGYIDFSSRLKDVLPWTRGLHAGEASLELLLAHRAGFEAHRELFRGLRSGSPESRELLLREAAGARRADAIDADPVEGFAPVYSDLGYLFAGLAIEAATGRDLDAWLTETLTPLHLESLTSARRAPTIAHAAATEWMPFRGGLVRGVVHDENAWLFGGSACCGHAGLFGCARDVAQFGCLMIDVTLRRNSALSLRSLDTLLRPRPGGSLRAGFDSKSIEGSSAGSILGPHTFGHLGFTGTSVWCDPELECVIVLLTNRVCPSRENLKIRSARPVIHDALARLAQAPLEPAPVEERMPHA